MDDRTPKQRYEYLEDVSARIMFKIQSLGSGEFDMSEKRRLNRILEHHVYPEMRQIAWDLGLLKRTIDLINRQQLAVSKAITGIFGALFGWMSKSKKPQPPLLSYRPPE